MKIEEAIKKAAPELSVGLQGNPTMLYGKMPSGETCRVAMVEERIDAALLAHWYKHGPKLLEALKKELTFNDDTRWTKEHLLKLITAAEEVEGI